MTPAMTLVVALVLLVLLALVLLAVLLGRRSRNAARPRPTAKRPGPARQRPVPAGRVPADAPAPREIWWAEVPFEDGPGSKDRPCLVLSVHGRTATVAKITSKHHAEQPGVLALPPGVVGDREGRTSWLETGELREVPLAHFRRRVGLLDGTTWARTERAVRAR